MSSILKALEKVEESQNTRRSGGGNAFVISRKRRPGWVIPAGVLGGAVVASLVTFAAMGGLSRPAPQVASLQAAPNPIAAAPPAPVPVAPLHQVVEEPAARPGQTLARQPAEGVAVPAKVPAQPRLVALPRKVVAVPAKSPSAPASRPAAKARPQTAPFLPFHAIPVVQPSAAEVAAARFKPASTAAPLPGAQATGQARRQDLRVTGIAWQKESGSSAAIVNGRTLKEGATVDGYKVERIFENHVTFSGSNGRLKVPLGGGE